MVSREPIILLLTIKFFFFGETQLSDLTHKQVLFHFTITVKQSSNFTNFRYKAELGH